MQVGSRGDYDGEGVVMEGPAESCLEMDGSDGLEAMVSRITCMEVE